MRQIFISHKSGDPDAHADFIGSLKGEILALGFEPWAFQGRLVAGDEWRPEIDQAIKGAVAVVVVMTPSAKVSEYVTYEWSFALGAGKPVVPLMLAQTKPHPRLEALQHEDFTNGARPWDALAKALRKHGLEPKQTISRELTTFQSNLRAVLDEPDAVSVGASARDQAPPAARNAAELLARQPSSVWEEALRTRKEFHDRLEEFQQAYSDFGSAADRLDRGLQAIIRHHNASKEIIAVNDPVDRAFFLGRIRGATPEQLLPWLDMPRTVLPRLEESYAAASSAEEVVRHVPLYLDARARLATATEALKKALT